MMIVYRHIYVSIIVLADFHFNIEYVKPKEQK